MPQNNIVPRPGGAFSKLNISAATVVNTGPATLYRIVINTAGSTAGQVYDASAAGGNVAANLIAELPNTVGPIELAWPCFNGISIVTGTGQVVSVSYSP